MIDYTDVLIKYITKADVVVKKDKKWVPLDKFGRKIQYNSSYDAYGFYPVQNGIISYFTLLDLIQYNDSTLIRETSEAIQGLLSSNYIKEYDIFLINLKYIPVSLCIYIEEFSENYKYYYYYIEENMPHYEDFGIEVFSLSRDIGGLILNPKYIPQGYIVKVKKSYFMFPSVISWLKNTYPIYYFCLDDYDYTTTLLVRVLLAIKKVLGTIENNVIYGEGYFGFVCNSLDQGNMYHQSIISYVNIYQEYKVYQEGEYNRYYGKSYNGDNIINYNDVNYILTTDTLDLP